MRFLVTLVLLAFAVVGFLTVFDVYKDGRGVCIAPKGYVKELLPFNKLLNTLATMPSDEKIVNKTQGVVMEEIKETTPKSDGVVQEKIALIEGNRFAGNAEVLAMVADNTKSVNDLKAKLYDLEKAEVQSVIKDIQKDNINAKVDKIDTTSADEDTEASAGDAYLAFAQEHKGEIK